jgi:exosome complex component RRP40
MQNKIDTVVIPGDVIGEIRTTKLQLGAGIIQNKDTLIATKAGVLRHKPPDKYWIENNQKRYVPTVDDMVIGIITEKHAEEWKVDIGCHQFATLSAMAFEGATKRNRPNLNVGNLVYARVMVANKDAEPELTCTSTQGKADGFGPLFGGYMFKCDTKLVRECLAPNSRTLLALGKHIPYEIAVGMNGRIWVNSSNVESIILVANAIQNSEYLNKDQVEQMIAKIVQNIKHQN